MVWSPPKWVVWWSLVQVLPSLKCDACAHWVPRFPHSLSLAALPPWHDLDIEMLSLIHTIYAKRNSSRLCQFPDHQAPHGFLCLPMSFSSARVVHFFAPPGRTSEFVVQSWHHGDNHPPSRGCNSRHCNSCGSWCFFQCRLTSYLIHDKSSSWILFSHLPFVQSCYQKTRLHLHQRPSSNNGVNWWVCSQVLNNLPQKRICGYASSHVFTTGNAQLSFFISRNQWSSKAHPGRSHSCIQGCIVAQYFIRKETGNVVFLGHRRRKRKKKRPSFWPCILVCIWTSSLPSRISHFSRISQLFHIASPWQCQRQPGGYVKKTPLFCTKDFFANIPSSISKI